MYSDTALRSAGMKILADNLGEVDAARFIFLIKSDHFDYTEWQRDLFKDMSIKEISAKAMEYRNSTD
jgi:hypothetical protein